MGAGSPQSGVIGAIGQGELRRGELRRLIDAWGVALRAVGIGRGNVVATLLPHGSDPAVTFLAVANAAVAAPLDPGLPASAVQDWLSDVRPSLLVTSPDLPADLAAAASDAGVPVAPVSASGAGELTIDPPRIAPASDDPIDPQPEDVALLLHTSGTTARPKRVPIRHRNLAASARNIATTLDLGPGDRCLNLMPLFHIHGLVAGVLASLAARGTVVCAPAFNGADVFDWIEQARPTWITAVPTMYQGMLDRAAAHPAVMGGAPLRVLRSSSSALPGPVHARLEAAFGVPVVEAYGMTEAAHQIASNSPGDRMAGSVGRPAGPEVRVIGEDGAEVPAGSDGRIVIRGDNVFDGYTDADPGAFADGWFVTGDIGRLDADGRLWLTGRAREMVNRGGETIAPGEIDDALLGHPAVERAMAFGVPDHRLGEQVAALVVAAPGTSPDERELRTFLADRLAPGKIPRRILFVDDVPRGPTGKPRRIGIAAELGLADLDGRPAATAADPEPPTGPVESLLHQLWVDVLRRDPIGVRDRFLDSGGDSLLAMRLLARVSEALDLDIPIVDFFDRPTISDQARLVEELLLA